MPVRHWALGERILAGTRATLDRLGKEFPSTEACYLDLMRANPFLQPCTQALEGFRRVNPGTNSSSIRSVRSLNLIPLKVNKELLGFYFNRDWRAIKREALHMWADGAVEHREDRHGRCFPRHSGGPLG